MAVVPESFLIFKEELAKERLAKEKLAKEYEEKIQNLNKELSYLKEQIEAQTEMIKTTIDYASKLEERLDSFDKEVKTDKQGRNKSYH